MLRLEEGKEEICLGAQQVCVWWGEVKTRQALQMIPGPLVERLCLGMTCPKDPAGDLLSLGKAKFVRGRV